MWPYVSFPGTPPPSVTRQWSFHSDLLLSSEDGKHKVGEIETREVKDSGIRNHHPEASSRVESDELSVNFLHLSLEVTGAEREEGANQGGIERL